LPPPTDRDLSEDECLAALVAIHDVCRVEREQIGPTDFVPFLVLRSSALELTEAQLPELEAMLAQAQAVLTPAAPPAGDHKGGAIGGRPALDVIRTTPEHSTLALLRVYTNGTSDERFKKAAELLADDTLTTEEKLTKIDALIPLPPTASAETLGQLLGVSKQMVLKTRWWVETRKGEKDNEIGRRRAGHQKRANDYEPPSTEAETK
jgi:hypothetical protein